MGCMRKALAFIALSVLVIMLFLLMQNLGDVRPAILPPSKDITKIIEEREQAQKTKAQIGEPVDFPLKLPPGFEVGVFAKKLGSARDLEFSPGGTLLVSIPASGKVIALPDKNNDGKADEAKEVITLLRRPHGIVFHDKKLFVAEETRVVR